MTATLRQAPQRWRRNPSLVHLGREVQRFADSLPVNALVLDAGAGNCCYKRYFVRQRYESADFAQVSGKQYGTIDYVCDLRSIPVAAGRFDAVLCTQVLAHLPEPGAALRELRRVLKPGGVLLLSCPLFFHENEKPYDYFRYTQFGLRELLVKAGFTVQRLDWLEGYSGTVSYQLSMAARFLRARPADYGNGVLGWLIAALVMVFRPLAAVLSVVFALADERFKNTATGMCKNYVVIARAGNGTEE